MGNIRGMRMIGWLFFAWVDHHGSATRVLMILAALTSWSVASPGGTLKQYAIELTSRINVLNVSVRPGCEDFATLAYLRTARGANIVSVYVSNGEAGESDMEGLSPHQLAAVRRQEAVEAIGKLGGEVVFLNFPDIVTAGTTRTVTDLWAPDSLRIKLAGAISRYKPDVVLLSMDRFCRARLIWHEILEQTITVAINEADSIPGARWRAGRFLVERETRNPITVPVAGAKDNGRAYLTIAARAADAYRSLHVQCRVWKHKSSGGYAIASGFKPFRGRSVDANLPLPAGKPLASLARQMEGFAATIQRQQLDAGRSLHQASSLIDSISNLLLRNRGLAARQRRDVLLWKDGLENIRNTLLGVNVSFRMSESIITDRQMVYLTIDSVSGASPDGLTELYIPAMERGWILNETSIARLPLHAGEAYRLVSPHFSEYDLPFQESGLDRQTIGHPLYVFIIHKARSRARSFTYRIVYPFLYAPRFTTEVLTPIVAMVPNEKLVVRLTNHSRDGVQDRIGIDDSLAWSSPIPFRLNEKEASHLDTLTLAWRDTVEEGTYLFPLKIGGVPVARFAARKFDFRIDTLKRVAIVSGINNSPLLVGVRRLGLSKIDVTTEFDVPLMEPDAVLLVDRRSLSFSKNLGRHSEELVRFAESGGHVIACAQDATTWNASAFGAFFQLDETHDADASSNVWYDESSPIMTEPNRIEPSDFDGFVFRRNHNLIAGVSKGVVVRSSTMGNPLVISMQLGRGRITYIDLALDAQLMNVHPGTYRLLANVISLRAEEAQ